MNVWRTAPVAYEPEILLGHWRIIELPDGDRHFYGYRLDAAEGRVSSKIVTYDPVAKRGVTRSGRVYRLEGESGFHPDAEYVWAAWKRLNDVVEFKDITKGDIDEESTE